MIKKSFIAVILSCLSFFAFAKSDFCIVIGNTTSTYQVTYDSKSYKFEDDCFSISDFKNYNFISNNEIFGFFEDLNLAFTFDESISFLAGPAICFKPADFFNLNIGFGPYLEYKFYTYEGGSDENHVEYVDEYSEPEYVFELDDGCSYEEVIVGGGIDLMCKFFANRRCSIVFGSKFMIGGFVYDHRTYYKNESLNVNHGAHPVFSYEPYAGIGFNFGI